MRALLFLGLVGAAIYGFLIVTGESGGTSKDFVAIQTQLNPSADQQLSSWGSYLPSRPSSANPQAAGSQKFVASIDGSEEPGQKSGRDQVAARENAAASSARDGVKAGSSIVSPPPTQVAEGSVTEPLTSNRTARKSIKRSPAKREGVVNADPWNERGSRRAERRRGLGLFSFRQAPRFAVNGR